MTRDLVIIVPTRGRPENMRTLAEAFKSTCTANTHLLFAVDSDDASIAEYRQVGTSVHVTPNPERTMVACLNRAARDVLADAPYAIGFMGDDHRPRTRGWDTAYLEALRRLGTGIVYGDDGVQGERLPTQVAMTADIVQTLGWMAPPVLRHMYVDNFWRDLGVHAGCLRYLRDVAVEHLHPVAGTAEMDAGYARVNATSVYEADAAAYRQFCASGAFQAAVDAVRALQPPDTGRLRHVGMARASFVAEAAYITSGATVADVAPAPTDLSYLLGPALQVRSEPAPFPADIVAVTEGQAVPSGYAAAVTAGVPVQALTAAGYTLLRTRTIGGYLVALGVRP